MKKPIAFVLILILLFASAAPCFSAGDSEAMAAAQKLHSPGLLNGVGTLPNGETDFGLDASLTREQAAIMLLRLLGKEAEGTDLSMPFKDVAPWARQGVAYAYRLGRPEDIAGAVAFFAKEEAGFITGQVLTADGGFIL